MSVSPRRASSARSLPEGHSRLDQRISQSLVDVEDPVHPTTEVEHDLTVTDRRELAQPEVVPGTRRPQRDAVFACQPHYCRDVLRRRRADHPANPTVAAGQPVVAVAQPGLVGDVDGICSDTRPNGVEEIHRLNRTGLAGIQAVPWRPPRPTTTPRVRKHVKSAGRNTFE